MKPIKLKKPIKVSAWTLRRKGDQSRGWPSYLFWGRMRTSTVALIIAFVVTSWLYQTYRPPPAAVEQPTQVVPPGFVPDPEYTWVPRTNVQERPRTTTPRTTTTTTTTEPSPTDTPSTTPTTPTTPTSPTTPTTPTSPTDEVPTTVVDPDGPGLIPPITLPAFPPPAPATPPPPAGSVN